MIQGSDSGESLEEIAGEESEVSWTGVLQSLIERDVGLPRIAVVDGNPGLEAALRAAWPKIDIQRSTLRSPRRAVLWAWINAHHLNLEEDVVEIRREMHSYREFLWQKGVILRGQEGV